MQHTDFLLRVLLLGIHLKYCTASLEFSGQSSITSAHLIFDDIHRAFADVINNTSDIKKLMPKMYDLNVTNPPVIFKVPIQDGAAIILMQRSDFASPQFPNLTKSYVELMQERRYFLQNIPEENLNHNQDNVKNNDWDKLGLIGWIGEISRPTQYLPSNKKVKDSLYASEFLRDVKLKEVLNKIRLENTADKTIRSQNQLKSDKMSMEKHADITNNSQDSNVFIARVNDPFGFSSSWELRSSSEHGNINSTTLETEDNRLKRDVVKLYSMIKCSTGCDPLIFKGYGCYCGFLGAGIPVDGIDRCCKLHDKCYEYSNCISYLEYFVPYIWKCYHGKPLCAIDHGEFGGPHSCAARLCKCDLRLSLCLRRFSCPHRRASCRSSAARQLQNLIFY